MEHARAPPREHECVEGGPPRRPALTAPTHARPYGPQVWYEYGVYCSRSGSRGRAEQCLREALALEPGHVGALAALLGVSLTEGRATDPVYLEVSQLLRVVRPQLCGHGWFTAWW
jgi:hypothetical protein